jgi:uncharacterized membrane protein
MPETTTLTPSPMLRLALLGDAAASGGMGLLLAAAARPLTGLLGLPEPLLATAGLILLPYAALIAWAGTREAVARNMVRAIVAVNLVWALDSLLLLAFGPRLAGIAPSGLGIAFVLAQALAVLGFAIAQAAGLRRSQPLAAAA